MKFSIHGQNFFKSLNIVSKAISNRGISNVLDCIYISASGNSITFIATDGNFSIINKTQATINIEGDIIISSKLLMDISKSFIDDEIHFDIVKEKDTYKIKINSQNSDIELLGRDASEFPTIEKYAVKGFSKIDNNTLKSMIKECVFACNLNESSSPMLTGVFIEFVDDHILFTALDGYKLAHRSELLDEACSNNINCIVPGKNLNEVLKILSIEEDEALIDIVNNNFIINIGNTQIISNIINAVFLNYLNVIPKQINTVAKINKNVLLKSVERASIINNEIKNSLISLNYVDEKIIIESKSDIGSVNDEFEINKTGNDVNISLNSKYLLEILKNINDERILIEMENNTKPMVIKSVENEKYLYLIMPVRAM